MILSRGDGGLLRLRMSLIHLSDGCSLGSGTCVDACRLLLDVRLEDCRA